MLGSIRPGWDVVMTLWIFEFVKQLLYTLYQLSHRALCRVVEVRRYLH